MFGWFNSAHVIKVTYLWYLRFGEGIATFERWRLLLPPLHSNSHSFAVFFDTLHEFSSLWSRKRDFGRFISWEWWHEPFEASCKHPWNIRLRRRSAVHTSSSIHHNNGRCWVLEKYSLLLELEIHSKCNQKHHYWASLLLICHEWWSVRYHCGGVIHIKSVQSQSGI